MNLYVKQTRPIALVPKKIIGILLLSLFLQGIWHFAFHKVVAKHYDLALPPQISLIKLVSLDDPITAAKAVMLWLQAFDNQPGVSIPLRDLNYHKVIEWLDVILALDNKIEYPLLAAIRFYAEVPDVEKQRAMVAYISQKFIEQPDQRWAFMAHAVYIAKHRIKDVVLALRCAKLIRQHATGKNVPFWAQQMEIFILEDMGELESAKILIGGLLESGVLDDPHQRRFLGQRLREIADRQLQDTVQQP